MAPRGDDRLVSAWVDGSLIDAVDALTDLYGISRSALVRLALVQLALRSDTYLQEEVTSR